MTEPNPSGGRWKRGLCVVVLFAAFGWFVAWPAYRQHQAIQEIERIGGMTIRASDSSRVVVRPREADWNDPIVGVTFFRSGERFNSSVLKCISSLPTVHRVILNDVPTNGDGLEHLRGSRVTNLQLVNSTVDDVGVMKISTLENLEQLMLDGTKITDDGLRSLRSLKKLELLSLTDTRISDEGLKHLSTLNRLDLLCLDSTRVSDDGLSHLSGLTNLRVLHLSNTDITDDGLKRIAGLSNLEMLYIADTKVTAEGVEMLQETLPKCLIER